MNVTRLRFIVIAALVLSFTAVVRAEEPVEKDLTVHEWGVFRVHTDAEMANGIKQPPRGKLPKGPAPPQVEKGHWFELLRRVKCDEVFARHSQNQFDIDREKFVYYDGIFPQGKWLKIEAAEGKVTLSNQVKHSVFDVTVIDHRDEKKVSIARVGELQPGAKFMPTEFDSGNSDEFAVQAAKKLTGQLVMAGLFEDEAQVLAELWKKELFEESGLHVCFRLPQEEYEQRLPMTLSPRPASLVRVGLVVQTYPDPTLAEKIAVLVKELDADDFAAREAAQKKLKGMGRGIYGHLLRLQKTDLPAEARIRVRAVLAEIDSSLAFPQQPEKP
jgi:hypothetical protein